MSYLDIAKKILEVTKIDLDVIQTAHVSDYSKYIDHDISYFHGESGKEHYRLLMYISSLFNDVILYDIGTNRGMSAVALSNNKSNKIKTFDIVQLNITNPEIENIEYILGDSTKTDISQTNFIFLDVDHDGLYEDVIYKHLKDIKWEGILVLDDIHLNDAMKNFWEGITEEKHDITSIGHWSGTGLVIFKTDKKVKTEVKETVMFYEPTAAEALIEETVEPVTKKTRASKK